MMLEIIRASSSSRNFANTSLLKQRRVNLRCLLELMIKFRAHDFAIDLFFLGGETATGTNYRWDAIEKSLTAVEEFCTLLGLNLSARQANRLRVSVDKKDESYMLQGLNELQTRLYDELEVSSFISIDGKRMEYFDKPNLFGEDVFNNFGNAIYDVEEAGKCLALARYTASVMHLQRVMECAVTAYGKMLGLPITINNWGAILNTTGQELEKRTKAKSWASKDEQDFCEGVQPLLIAIKNAWRNPSMHVERTYDEDEAEDIFISIRGFMRHIAKHLNQDGVFRP